MIQRNILERDIRKLSGTWKELSWDGFNKRAKVTIFQALSSIRMEVISGNTNKWKLWFDKNLPGSYSLFGFYNDRPVYKVSFILSTKR